LGKSVREIMVKDVLTVRKETSLRDLAEILISRHISGAPVVDKENRYLGVVGEHDLIRHERPLHIPTVMTLFDSWIPLELPSSLRKEMERISATSVGDLYNPKAPTVTPDTPIREAVSLFEREDVDILPVLDSGRLVGVVGRGDLVHLLVTGDDLID
jgi:CBS domain-containing protein